MFVWLLSACTKKYLAMSCDENYTKKNPKYINPQAYVVIELSEFYISFRIYVLQRGLIVRQVKAYILGHLYQCWEGHLKTDHHPILIIVT